VNMMAVFANMIKMEGVREGALKSPDSGDCHRAQLAARCGSEQLVTACGERSREFAFPPASVNRPETQLAQLRRVVGRRIKCRELVRCFCFAVISLPRHCLTRRIIRTRQGTQGGFREPLHCSPCLRS